MFFDEIESIPKIASRYGTSIFILPKDVNFVLPGSITLSPESKKTISIEQVREILSKLNLKQVNEQYILIRPAENLSIEASNALLKNFEEPKEKVHFILITDSPSNLLPTILSRGCIFFYKTKLELSKLGVEDEKIKQLAKELLSSNGKDLVVLADKITAKQKEPRARALLVLGLAIEMLYKTYFLTNKDVFLKKLPKFLKAYDNINANGHIKLHLVADLC